VVLIGHVVAYGTELAIVAGVFSNSSLEGTASFPYIERGAIFALGFVDNIADGIVVFILRLNFLTDLVAYFVVFEMNKNIMVLG
jgi:hypothetical protein